MQHRAYRSPVPAGASMLEGRKLESPTLYEPSALHRSETVLTVLPAKNGFQLTGVTSPPLVRRLFGAALAVCAVAGFGLVSLAWLRGGAESSTALLTFVTVFVAALASSVAGFAFSALAGSALVHVYASPAQAVEIMALCSVAIQLYAVIVIRRSIE